MSRLSFRPRPLDIHKKLPLVKSIKEFEDDDSITSARNSQFWRLSSEVENEVLHVSSKKLASEIPTPQYVVVDTYVRDYARTFNQPTSYLRGRGARAELGEFVEYDLDNEDDDWLRGLKKERKILPPEQFESLLFKLEVLDHKARERASVITPTPGSSIPVLLHFDAAIEALQAQFITYGVFHSIYTYWREKRERCQKPILRRLQPPPPINDTNPFNVFRPREKAHRLHTRRMQRRENNTQSFEKLRQVRRNLEQTKTVLEALIKREEKKRDVMENEVSLQRVQLKYKYFHFQHVPEFLEDSLPGFQSGPGNFGSSDDEYVDSGDVANSRPPAAAENSSFADIIPVFVANGRLMRDLARRQIPNGWLHKLDPLEPVLLFTKPIDTEKLAAAGIVPLSDISSKNDSSTPPCKFHGRIGRGGRVVFDRWNPLSNTALEYSDSFYVPPKSQPTTAYN